MFGGKLNHEAQFFVDGYELSGIESIDITTQNSNSIGKPLGSSKGVLFSNGPVQQKLAVSRYLIYDDPIFNYTGDSSISGSIEYEGSSYGFNSGYLSSYSVNCAVGAIPKVNANFDVYDEMRSGVSASGSAVHPDIYIPSQGSISVTCDNSTTNRVVGFDYAVNSQRAVYYTLGQKEASSVVFIPPLEYSASVQIQVDDAFLSSGFNFIDSREDKTVSFTINGRNGSAIQTLTIPKASIVAEQLRSSADGSMELTINYIGHS